MASKKRKSKVVEMSEPKLYRKQVLRVGEWRHSNAPGGVLKITSDYLKKLVENFKKTPFVPVTRGHAGQEEIDKNPSLIVSSNVKRLEADDNGLYADIELDPIELERYNDVSASIDPSAEDHETGGILGPVLRGIAVTTNPYIKGMSPFVALGESKGALIINLSDISEMPEETKTAVAEAPEKVVEKVEEVAAPAEVATEPTTEAAPEVKSEEVPAEKPVEEVVETPSEEKPAQEAPVEEAPVKEEEMKEEVDGSEVEKLKVELAEARAMVEEERVKKAEALSRAIDKEVEILLSEGRVTPAQTDAVKALLKQDTQTVDLAEGESKSVAQLFREYLQRQPKAIDFSEKGIRVEGVSGALSEEAKEAFAFLKTSKEALEAYKKLDEK